MSIFNPTEDQLNEWLSQQPMRGTIGGNRLADLVSPELPMNSFRNNATGQGVSLPSIQEQGGMSLNDLLSQTGANIQDKVILQDKGVGYRTPTGNVVGLDSAGRPWKLEGNPRPPTLKEAMAQAQYEGMLLENQTKQAQLRGGVKPQLVDGQWVFPPSQDAPTGRAVPVEGFQAQIKPPSDEQSKASGFLERSITANSILQTIGSGTPEQGKAGQEGEVQPGLIKRAFGAVPFYGEEASTAMNWTQSAPQQQVEQAQRDFVNAILRRESGAVINPSEFDNAAKQYFPQPGDSRQVIAQKTKNRENAMSALETSAGNSPVIVKKVQGAKAQSQALIDAYAAIRKGADPSAVKARLEQMGVSYHGIK